MGRHDRRGNVLEKTLMRFMTACPTNKRLSGGEVPKEPGKVKSLLYRDLKNSIKPFTEQYTKLQKEDEIFT